MTVQSKIEYDYSGVDRVVGIPTTGQLIRFQKQVGKIQSSYKCNISEAKDHGWSWIMCTTEQWLEKKNITHAVPVPTDPGPYTGDTNALYAEHKLKLLRFEEYEEHKRNTNKVILAKFDEDLLVEIETDGSLIGYTPHEVYQYMWTNFILMVDKDREILHARELLKVEYDPDRIPQHYYKAVNDARELLTGLRETVTDDEVIRNAYATFEKHIDLKEACRDWIRGPGTTWEQMKKHFSKEIQMNRTDPAIMRRKELANAAMKQTEEDDTDRRTQQELAILQTQKIQELQEQLKEVANSVTKNNFTGRIPALIDTSDSSKSGGGSTTSTVTKDEMMQMFAQFTQNLKQGECTVIPPTGTGVSKQKNKFGTNYIRNDLPNGERTRRRYPDSTSYCPSCGYDIKPTHTPASCANKKAWHNNAATLENKMGGVTTNCHFAT